MVGLFMNEISNQEQAIIQPVTENIKPKNQYSFFILISILVVIILFLIYMVLNQQKQIEKIKNQKSVTDTVPIIEPTPIPITTVKPKQYPTLMSERSENSNDNYCGFKNEDLNVIFEYPCRWGEKNYYNGKGYLGIFFKVTTNNFDDIKNIFSDNGLVVVASDPLSKERLDGVGGDWIMEGGYILKTKDDFKNLCPKENEFCKKYINSYGVSIVKKYEFARNGAEKKTNQYYVYNQNSIYSSIVISDDSFDKTNYPPAEKEVADLVDSLRFIK